MTAASIIDLFPDRRRAVENARSVIRMDDATDDELHDACDVLFAWGEWTDRMTATEVRRAMQYDAPAAPAPARVPVALRNLALAAMVAVVGYAAVRTVMIHRADLARIEGRAE